MNVGHVLMSKAKEVTRGQFSAFAAVGNVTISQEECVNHSVTYVWMASDPVELEIEINCFNETHVSIVELCMTFCWHSSFSIQ